MVGVGPLDSTATLEIGSYSSAEALGFVAFEVLFFLHGWCFGNRIFEA